MILKVFYFWQGKVILYLARIGEIICIIHTPGWCYLRGKKQLCKSLKVNFLKKNRKISWRQDFFSLNFQRLWKLPAQDFFFFFALTFYSVQVHWSIYAWQSYCLSLLFSFSNFLCSKRLPVNIYKSLKLGVVITILSEFSSYVFSSDSMSVLWKILELALEHMPQIVLFFLYGPCENFL